MAPSASLQSRISAFEALDSGINDKQPKLKGGVRLAPLNLPRIAVQQNILDSDSTSPTADALCAIPPMQPVATSSRPSSPAALGRKSSLIDFSELTSPKLKPVSVDGTGATSSTSSSNSTSETLREHRQLPLKPQFPPLPPRRPSVTSLKVQPSSTPTMTPPPLPKRHASSPVSLPEPKNPNNYSLLNAPDSHTYPPTSPRRGPSPAFHSRHMPSSSTSSFHSVSLSSDGGDTRESLDGSYEAVSSTAATSPTVSTHHDLEYNLNSTPTLPQWQWQKQVTPYIYPTISPTTSATARRPPPPPPTQRRPVKQQTPSTVSPVALTHYHSANFHSNTRKRYDALFECNLPQNPRKGHASGWRGLSVDLLTNGEKSSYMEDFSKEERLDGSVIKSIWTCSRLPKVRLREIWVECDPDGLGSLDRDAFAKGMWRIDELLSRAHQQPPKAPLLSSKFTPLSYAPRAPPLPLRKPNFLLR